MKKVLFALAITGAFTMTSCKKGADVVEAGADATTEAAGTVVEAGADAANATVEAAGSLTDLASGLGVEVPEFANAALGTWATSLLTTGAEAKTAATAGNPEGVASAVTKFTSLGTDLQNFKDDPDFSKAMDLYNKVKTVLESL